MKRQESKHWLECSMCGTSSLPCPTAAMAEQSCAAIGWDTEYDVCRRCQYANHLLEEMEMKQQIKSFVIARSMANGEVFCQAALFFGDDIVAGHPAELVGKVRERMGE